MRLWPTTSLQAKLFMVVAVFWLLMAVAFAATLYIAHRNYYSEMMQQDAMTQMESAAAMHPELGQLARSDPAAAHRILAGFPTVSASDGIYVLDTAGRVLASSGTSRAHWKTWRVNMTPLNRILQERRYGKFSGDDPDHPGEVCLFAVAPLGSRAPTDAFLYFQMRTAQATSHELMAIRSSTIQAALWSGGFILLLGFLLTTVLMALLTRPLRRLTAVINSVRAGGFDAPVDEAALPSIGQTDEIGTLSAAFRDMLSRLREQMRRVQRTDSLRRELVASVSHDLRTPLTSLIGNLETVRMKGATLDAATQQQFLDVALRNAQHLDELTASLFELARLDDDQVRIAREPLSLGELADDVVQRFSSRAVERGIALNVEYDDDLPMLNADASLIERALANLLDNALRHTPAAGHIDVVAASEPSGLVLTVSDSGVGIEPADLANMFERFFQGGRHREGRGHAGLGLAIVKRVVELHGGSAVVANNDGPGCRFTLHFPLEA